MWGFPKIRGTFFGGPHNKDYNILGSILGSTYFGKLPCSSFLGLVWFSGKDSYEDYQKGITLESLGKPYALKRAIEASTC